MASDPESSLNEVIMRGLAAVETDALDQAADALEQAQKLGGENHVRVLHLQGMLALAQGDLEHAVGFLMQATDLGPGQPEIYLDCAEALLLAGEELGEAEAITRAALDLPDVSEQAAGEARLTLAQIRLERDDVAGALQELEQVGESLQAHPAYLSTKAAALLADERADEALEVIAKAVERDPSDADFQYQLALTARAGGRESEATQAMLRVSELDAAGSAHAPLRYEEAEDLRGRLEDVLEDLPDPLLRLLASAPISVQGRATREQVESGLDPRSTVAFLGRPKQDDREAELEGIVIMRDLLLDEIETDDDLPQALFFALMEELRVFFRREDIVFDVAEA